MGKKLSEIVFVVLIFLIFIIMILSTAHVHARVDTGTLEVNLVERMDPMGPVLDYTDGCAWWGGMMATFQLASFKGVSPGHYRAIVDAGETKYDGMKAFLHSSISAAYALPKSQPDGHDVARWANQCRAVGGKSWLIFRGV